MTFLRPNSSPTMPKASIALANVSAYAPTIHCRASTPACRSACTLPSPTLTIVLSRKVRKSSVHKMASATGPLPPWGAATPVMRCLTSVI